MYSDKTEKFFKRILPDLTKMSIIFRLNQIRRYFAADVYLLLKFIAVRMHDFEVVPEFVHGGPVYAETFASVIRAHAPAPDADDARRDDQPVSDGVEGFVPDGDQRRRQTAELE